MATHRTVTPDPPGLYGWRRARGLSKAQVAKRIQRCPGMITHYESGRFTPPPAIQERLARLYHVPLAQVRALLAEGV